MMFADFGQWRAVWQQRGKALVRRRSAVSKQPGSPMPETPQASAATQASAHASVSTALDAVASTHQQGKVPTDFGLPQGWVWGADGVKDTAVAVMAPSSAQYPQHDAPPDTAGCDPQRPCEPPTPERLRIAGAI